MRITVKQLEDAGACREWLTRFKEDLGRADSTAEFEWTPAAQGWLLASNYRQVFGWLIHNGFLPMWSMSGANLRGADLLGADLRGADLEGANLSEADLRWAILEGAFLIGANLEGADLRGAFLIGANLWGTNLRGTNLRGTDLRGTNLRGTNLRGANHDEYTKWPEGWEASYV